MFELLQYPFALRAFLAGIMASTLLSFMGVFVSMKKIAFLGEGVAHASLAGIAIGVLVAVNPLAIAIIYAVLFVLLLYILEKKTAIHSDTLIGILFTGSLALGVVILSFRKTYQPELMSFLFGNILTIRHEELIIMASVIVILLIYSGRYLKQILFSFFDSEAAFLSRIPVAVHEVLMYIFLAIAIVLGVKIVGIILVSGLLLIPNAIGKLVARSLHELFFLSLFFGEFIVIIGLILSYIFNVPSGPSIVLFGTIIFFFMLLVKSFFVDSPARMKHR
jgi:ABC-type Mn2+/Zn2+ transport system permease subunit